MPINTHLKHSSWSADYAKSVEMWNEWYSNTAPDAFAKERLALQEDAKRLLDATHNLLSITAAAIQTDPITLEALRMSAGPSMARDRLAGLAGVKGSALKTLERGGNPKGAEDTIERIVPVLIASIDPGLAPWIAAQRAPTTLERAAFISVLGDRLASARTGPILRNAQETRQLTKATDILADWGYERERPTNGVETMSPGTYWERYPVTANNVSIPIDLLVQPHAAQPGSVPVLIEAKSAGDNTNTNKRRKEEVNKLGNLRKSFPTVRFLLLLGGYFPVTYLRYNKDSGIDWMWEHKLEGDMETAGFK